MKQATCFIYILVPQEFMIFALGELDKMLVKVALKLNPINSRLAYFKCMYEFKEIFDYNFDPTNCTEQLWIKTLPY